MSSFLKISKSFFGFFFSLLLANFLLVGCAREKITVHTEYISIEHLASYIVETPDQRKYCPEIGQRLIITWSLPKEYLNHQDLHLQIKVRFYDRSEVEESIQVNKITGNYLYYLLNDDYFDTGGILTYKVDLIGDGQVLEAWRHQIWAELIKLNDDEDDDEDDDENDDGE